MTEQEITAIKNRHARLSPRHDPQTSPLASLRAMSDEELLRFRVGDERERANEAKRGDEISMALVQAEIEARAALRNIQARAILAREA